MIGSFNKLLRNVASIKGKSAFDKVWINNEFLEFGYSVLSRPHMMEM